jgi:large subunit ribosomal protein L16
MILTPRKTKYKKQQKGRNFKKIDLTSVNSILPNLHEISLKVIDPGKLSSKNLLACKQTINKIIKRYGYLIMNLVADTPISKKPTEMRMGKGKGAINYWAKKVRAGSILFKIIIKNKTVGLRALKLVQNKLPINTKIISYEKH